MRNTYRDITELLASENPESPVYCIYEHVYRESTQHFLNGFPGRVLYAVKANNHAEVIRLLHASGVEHFDCASLEEISRVDAVCPDANKYFMNPVRLPGHARAAQERFGVRHFVIDHPSGLAPLLEEIDVSRSVIFARMAVSHESASEDLSKKFGARPDVVPMLLKSIAEAGAEPALAFNVGSGVTSPTAYAFAIGIAKRVLQQMPFKVRLLDVGGGFPKSYPDFTVPKLDEFFEHMRRAVPEVPLAANGEFLAEPGRALSAPGLSAITRVLLRKEDRVYLNDGMYGIFWELRCNGHRSYPCRSFRDGKPLTGPTRALRVFGPTCDSGDELPARIELPEQIDVGDHIEFGNIGAYSLSGRTDFNGFHSEQIVSLLASDASPPG